MIIAQKGDRTGRDAAGGSGNRSPLLLGWLDVDVRRKAGGSGRGHRKSISIGENNRMPLEVRANLRANLGVLPFRRGELENCIRCVGPSSCILPIAASAVHLDKSGSREAARNFTEYLKIAPDDLRVR